MAPKKKPSQGSKPSASAQSSSSASKKPEKQSTPTPEPSKKANPQVESESAAAEAKKAEGTAGGEFSESSTKVKAVSKEKGKKAQQTRKDHGT